MALRSNGSPGADAVTPARWPPAMNGVDQLKVRLAMMNGPGRGLSGRVAVLAAVFLMAGVALPATASQAIAALPEANLVKASALEARNQMRSLSRRVTMVRDVRAVMVDGRFNAADPGQPYVGFCGYLRVAEGPGWLPFFVSSTPSYASGASAKCAGPRSAEDYTAQFRAITTSRRARYVSTVTGCTAAQSACLPSYYDHVARTNDAYPNSYEFSRGMIR